MAMYRNAMVMLDKLVENFMMDIGMFGEEWGDRSIVQFMETKNENDKKIYINGRAIYYGTIHNDQELF
jgi:hypothetical protein